MRALPDSVERALRRFEPLAELSAETIAHISEGARAQRLPRGGRLWRTGQPAHEVFLVGRGLVSLHQVGGASGKVVVDFGGPGDLLRVENAVRRSVHDTTAYVVSEQAHVIVLSAEALQGAWRVDAALRKAFVRQVTRGPSSLERKLRVLAAGSARARLAAALLELAGRYGRDVGSSIVLPFAPPAVELADFAGVPRAQAAAIVERWGAHDVLYPYDDALVIEAPRVLEGLARGERVSHVHPSCSAGPRGGFRPSHAAASA
ncbi:MAG: cyclic nucleotide-binding domain-containing protein [Polyangiaceae bacterium]|jgi:CRP-like cAMP-binding protein|nr:cyclic nucleotide-binding domain-containing protein [Polyangiaceae bacterium]